MRRPAVEKGRAANEAPLVLGMRGSGGAPYQNCFDQQQVRAPMCSPQIWVVQERIMSLQAFIEPARPGSGSGIFVAEMLSTDL